MSGSPVYGESMFYIMKHRDVSSTEVGNVLILFQYKQRIYRLVHGILNNDLIDWQTAICVQADG